MERLRGLASKNTADAIAGRPKAPGHSFGSPLDQQLRSIAREVLEITLFFRASTPWLAKQAGLKVPPVADGNDADDDASLHGGEFHREPRGRI